MLSNTFSIFIQKRQKRLRSYNINLLLENKDLHGHLAENAISMDVIVRI